MTGFSPQPEIAGDERRWTVFELSEHRKQDRKYFSAILDELEHGGYEALLYELQHYDLAAAKARGTDPAVILQTEGLREQKEQSLASYDPVGAFLKEEVDAGEDAQLDWGKQIPKHDVYSAFLDFLKQIHSRCRVADSAFWKKTRKLLPIVDGGRKGKRGDQRLTCILPSLEQAQAALDHYLGKSEGWRRDNTLQALHRFAGDMLTMDAYALDKSKRAALVQSSNAEGVEIITTLANFVLGCQLITCPQCKEGVQLPHERCPHCTRLLPPSVADGKTTEEPELPIDAVSEGDLPTGLFSSTGQETDRDYDIFT